MKYCENCGKELADNAKVCVECGYSFELKKNATGNKNKIVAGLLALLFGAVGIHWFYLNRNTKGIVYLLCATIGWLLILPPFIVAILAFIDGIILLTMDDEKFNETY